MSDEDILNIANAEVEELNRMFNATQQAEISNYCKALFAIYTGYIKAGFTSAQAMQLVTAMMQAAIMQPKNDKGSDER